MRSARGISMTFKSVMIARRSGIVAAVALVVAAGAYREWRFVGAAPPAGAVTVAAPPPIPVGIAAVARQDVPVYLTGLGTVQAFNTVTVKTRVDGELQKVAFTEGQDVK